MLSYKATTPEMPDTPKIMLITVTITPIFAKSFQSVQRSK